MGVDEEASAEGGLTCEDIMHLKGLPFPQAQLPGRKSINSLLAAWSCSTEMCVTEMTGTLNAICEVF